MSGQDPNKVKVRGSDNPRNDAYADTVQNYGSGGGGGANTFDDIALESISAIKVVYRESGGLRVASSATTFQEAQIVGIATNSAAPGNTVTVQFDSVFVDGSFAGFIVGEPVYVNSTGSLTQTAPTTGFRTQVGHYVGNSTLYIQIEEPIRV